ncbi:MAG: hypothetical protein IPH12_11360 [Saprospirales bacterium]|nr:hypothetical protein [Saprospirales bacterium]MBK8919921.1 hypothetical protein [Saprospirales bacterium]
MKNYLDQTLWLALCVLLLMACLSFLPEGLPLAGLPLRKMDIFSDIQAPQLMPPPDTAAQHPHTLAVRPATDSTIADNLGLIPIADPSLFGRVIEDYSPGQQGLSAFFAAVDSIRPYRRTVRVAFFGDSFVEGDILLGDLRDTLQTLWGGAGVGYVPITSEVARFKRTLVHRYEKWNTYSIVKNHNSGQPFGINGFVYRPKPEAFVHYEGADYFRHTGNWSQVKLFYKADSAAALVWQTADRVPQTDSLPATQGNLSAWNPGRLRAPIRAFAFRVDFPDSNLLFYGATLEGGPGFYLDNFSVRGNTGGRLRLIKPELARQFDRIQHYDLIVVQLGLNAVTPSLDNLGWYRAELDQTFKHLQKCFPGKPVLVISVADRAGKINGELATLPAVPAIAAMQRELARQHGFLFYDLYMGMGGPGAMIEFAERHKPALANRDYTHLTHEGGKFMGRLFARLLVDEQQQFRQNRGGIPFK